jgi:hypothetical protein
MYYYIDYNKYNDQYNDDATRYDPPEASYNIQKPHYIAIHD